MFLVFLCIFSWPWGLESYFLFVILIFVQPIFVNVFNRCSQCRCPKQKVLFLVYLFYVFFFPGLGVWNRGFCLCFRYFSALFDHVYIVTIAIIADVLSRNCQWLQRNE